MEKKLAGTLAILAFFIVCVIGLIDGISPEVVLIRAIIALIVFFGVGWMCGYASVKLIQEWVTAGETPPKNDQEQENFTSIENGVNGEKAREEVK